MPAALIHCWLVDLWRLPPSFTVAQTKHTVSSQKTKLADVPETWLTASGAETYSPLSQRRPRDLLYQRRPRDLVYQRRSEYVSDTELLLHERGSPCES